MENSKMEQRYVHISRQEESEEEIEEERTQISTKRIGIQIPYTLDLKLIPEKDIVSKYGVEYDGYDTYLEEPSAEKLIPDYLKDVVINAGFVSVQTQSEISEIGELDTYLEDIQPRAVDIDKYSKLVVDVVLRKYESEKIDIDLDTSMEEEKSQTKHNEMPLLEELLDLMDGYPYFPRGRSEIGNRPIAIVIGEDKINWHEPVLYLLRELFRELTDVFPTVHFRKPEDMEDITEEMLDSTDMHSLENFRFEKRIEFLDARDSAYSIEDFFKILQNRFEASYLQRFGLFVIAVKKADLEEILKSDTFEKMNTIVINPKDDRFLEFSNGILGIKEEDDRNKKDSENDFRRILYRYYEIIKKTMRKYSVFVKQGGETENDKEYEQYPYKVAIFEYLVKKEIVKECQSEQEVADYFSNEEKMYKFIFKNIIGDERRLVKIEEPINTSKDTKIIPDIIYHDSSGQKGHDVFIEFETLIGTLEPMKKIDHSIEKYLNVISKNDEVMIVLRPVSALIHREELMNRLKIYKKLYDFEISIKVLCWTKSGWDLKELGEFKELIKPENTIKRWLDG